MSFKYINPGYANLLDADSGITVEDPTKSRTGVAFYQPKGKVGVEIPEMPKSFCMKFDLFIPDPKEGISEVNIISSSASNSYGIVFTPDSSNLTVRFFTSGISTYSYVGWTEKSTLLEKLNLRVGEINTFYFSVKYDGKTGTVICMNNGKTIFTRTANYIKGVEAGKIYVYSENEHGLLSSIIISDDDIDLHEQVVTIPIASMETDMASLDGGLYRAEMPNQKLLSSVEVSSLISEYGPLSKVTGVAIAGNPASKTDESMIKLTGLSVKDGQETEHGTKEPRADKTAGVADCFPADMTLADLSGMKFGWKASV